MSQENSRPLLWLAYELHDGLLQWLVSARMGVESAIPELEPVQSELRDKLQNTLTHLETALDEGRELIGFLENQSSHQEGSFSSKLDLFLGKVNFEVEEHGQRIICRQPENPWPSLPARTSWNLLRIVQQAVRNAIQHAGPATIEIECAWQDAHSLSLSIRDDGCGFRLDEASQLPGHFGLASLQQRAQLIGAELKLESAVGSGTAVHLRLPIA